MKSRVVSAAVVVVAGSCGRIGFDAGVRGTDGGGACPTWCIDDSPVGDDLGALWGDSDDDLWAVGGDGAIIHRDATGWNTVSRGVAPNLFGVIGFGSNDVWVFGDSGYAGHWDGSALAGSAVGVTTSGLGQAWGASSNDIWVNANDEGIVHWDGSAWSEVLIAGGATLFTMWGTSATDIWSAGQLGTTIHYDGSAWTRTTPGLGDVDDIEGLAPDDIWAAGLNESLHWDGSAWTPLSGEPTGAAVWEVSPTEIWFVGQDTSYTGDGTTWTEVPIGTTRHPQYLARPQQTLWAVGTAGLIMHHQ